jgi:hypothetical protein
MSANQVDLQPENLEVLQAESDGPEPAVNVHVDGPVRTQALPRKGGGTRTLTVTTTAVRLLRADHRRAQAVITSFDQDMYFAYNESSATEPTSMSRWPALVPLVVDADVNIYVRSFQATTTISYSTTMWATGE